MSDSYSDINSAKVYGTKTDYQDSQDKNKQFQKQLIADYQDVAQDKELN